MSTASISNNGEVLYYEDSGAPAASRDYITVVLVHGTCFHGTVYRPMIPYAAAHNIRLVLLNRRGYPGSTPVSSEELAALEGSISAQQAALKTRGAEIAEFLRWFIETEAIPPIGEVPGSGALVGGVSLLSWSGGNGTTLAMFAHADELPAATNELFNKYLRSFIIYDPSSTAAGNRPPAGIRNVTVDRTLPVEDRVAQFSMQVASFYPPYTLPDTLVGPGALLGAPRTALQDIAASTNTPLDPRYIPSISEPKMTVEQFKGMTYPPILDGLQDPIWCTMLQETFAANVVRALYDCRLETHDGSGMRKPVWPAVRVHVVWCDMTVGEAAWCAAVLKCGYAEATPEGRRPVEFHELKGANHFVHWEQPERFVKFLAEIV